MKKVRVLVVDEDGEVLMHAPVESYDLRQDYDHLYYSTGPTHYLPRPATAQISCNWVQTGVPNPAPVQGGGRAHNFDPITDLCRHCKDCGYKETLIAAMFGHQAPPCPGPKPGLAPGNLSVIVGTPKKPTSYGWTVVKKRDNPQPDRWVKFPVPGGCECGSDKAGLPTHSTWCPRAKT